MSTFIARQMTNGRWFVLQEGAAEPAITRDPAFEMGLSEERAHELARHASQKAGSARHGELPVHEPAQAAA